MLTRSFDMTDPARAVLRADAKAVCAARLTRVAGTHALLLDGAGVGVPSLPGVSNWTVLQPGPEGAGWHGPLRADAQTLPFGDDSFCVVLACFLAEAGVMPDGIAAELARVLAPHGALLVADLHPRSLWPAGMATPGRWERALRAADLKVKPVQRCGAPWPRVRGAEGLPHWLVQGLGGAYVIEARRRTLAGLSVLKPAFSRRVPEHSALLPGAHRQCA